MRISDWSSDVCSSDLVAVRRPQAGHRRTTGRTPASGGAVAALVELPSGRHRVRLREPVPGSARRRVAAGAFGAPWRGGRKSVVSGKSVSVRVDCGGSRYIQNNKKKTREKNMN